MKTIYKFPRFARDQFDLRKILHYIRFFRVSLNLTRLELFAFIVLILILFEFSYGPIIQNFRDAPKDRYYWGGIEYPIDNIGSMSIVREGMLSHWQMQYKFSSTLASKPGIVKIEYLIVGQIARFFHLDIIVAYFLTRFIISVANILLIAFLVSSIFKSILLRISGLFFAILATGITLPNDVSRAISSQLPQDIGVFLRITTAAHHYQLGIFFGLLAIFCLAKYLEDPENRRLFVVSLISGMITSIVYPPTSILIWMSLPIVFLIEIYHQIKYKLNISYLLILSSKLIVFVILTIFPLIYVRYLSGYWDNYSFGRTEKIVPFNPAWWHYFYLVGLTYFFSIPAILKVLSKRNLLFSFFLAWLIVHPIAMNFVAPIIGLNKTRVFLTPYFVIFGILAVVGIDELLILFKRLLKIIIKPKIGFSLAILLVVISSFETYKISINFLKACFCQGDAFAYGYPRLDEMSAWNWLRDNTYEDDIVMSENFAGMMIPVFAGNKVYTSHWVNIVNPPNIGEIATNKVRFLTGYMTDQEAKQFLIKNKIAYIYYGTEERWLGGKLGYPFLEKKYSNRIAEIYKVTIK